MGNNRAGQDTSGIPCNLCGSSGADELSLVDRDGNHLRTVICRNCGLVWTDPRPAGVREFYEKEYRLRYKGTYKPKPKHVYRAGKVAVARYERIRGYIRKEMSLLDVGSGGGEFIYLMRKVGCKTIGIEPNEGYAGYAVSEYGLDVRAGFMQDAMLEDGSQDIVTMWHVLEHTEDPTLVIGMAGGWIRQGGILALEVPNVEATCMSPPHRFHLAHLYNFNPDTLRRLGEKAGLKIVEQAVSGDGGNITAIFRKHEVAIPPDSLFIDGNYDRIAGVVRNHTVARHYASRHPYLRFAKKIRSALDEKISTINYAGGKRLLDGIFGLQADAPLRLGDPD
ncbi:MAG: Methyltransferase type 11 [Actinobacteria bacterium]|nr:Methyltransferase type 11 [Actinomycetota bacterium]